MKLSLAWLSRYLERPVTAAEADELLTRVGLEFEGQDDPGEGIRDIVIGSVLTCDKHAKADKLSVCTVGDGTAEYTVVCGAPNVRAGQKIAFARPGTRMESLGFTIENKTIRGVESQGMICSARELGMGDDHSGILVLDENAPLGMSLAGYLGKDDVTIEVGITPNRGDALSHIGVARDISAARGEKLLYPELTTPPFATTSAATIHIDSPDLCPRYSAAILRGIRVGPSPRWLANALESIGIRSINSVVDITNFVMMEIGQPMHAFDLRNLRGGRIIVRGARDGENFVTLDGKQHALPEHALLICDAERPVAIAGVMGGLNSEVTSETTDLLLESAYFNPSSVRKTAKTLGISTESSYRFERGTDPERTIWALQRAVDLIVAASGGTLEGIIDDNPRPYRPERIVLRPRRTDALLGTSIPVEAQRRHLEALEVSVTESDGTLLCTPPPFRSDLEREIDLIEEIARMHGYDSIPAPATVQIETGGMPDDDAFIARLRSDCLALGMDEILSPTLIATSHAALIGVPHLSVLNPVSTERPTLRNSLLPPLLEIAGRNFRNGIERLRLFEIGTVFAAAPESGGEPASEESMVLALLVAGNADDREWYAPERPVDFFDLKGVCEGLFDRLLLDKASLILYDCTSSLAEYGLSFEFQGKTLGHIMNVRSDLLESFDITQKIFYAEFPVSVLETARKAEPKYSTVSKYPAVKRDIAFLIASTVPAKDITSAIACAPGKYLIGQKVVDVFQHASFGAEKKSMAVSLLFQASDHTLTDAEIAAEVNVVVSALHSRFEIVIRS